jgi:uncharacterized protein
MSETMAMDILDHFSDKFDGVKEIFFFGGEPLLALNVLKSVCRRAEQLVDNGNMAEMPLFSVVTNGTLFSDDFIRLASRYRFGITVSIDGPPAIHDLHRRTSGNRGTSECVLEGIVKLKSNALPFSAECTYTREHWESGYSVIAVHEYLESLGASTVILSEEIVRYPDKGLRDPKISQGVFSASLDLFSHAIKECLFESKLVHAGLARMFDSLINRPKLLEDNFCGAGINNFAVNPIGETYPCHMLNNQPQFRLGNYRQITTPIEILPKKNSFQACAQCPIKAICRACPARMYLTSESGKMLPDPEDCRVIMAFACIARSALSRGDFSNILSSDST